MGTIVLKLKDEKTIPLDIPAGWFVVVAFTTQAGWRWKVTIADKSNVYFEKDRQNTNPNPPEWASFQTKSDELTIAFTVNEASNLVIRYNKFDVTDNNSNIVAKTCTFVGEDHYDQDYNDVWITVAAWKYAG